MPDKLQFEIGLNAAVVAIVDGQPSILLVQGADRHSLPYGRFDPHRHRTMEAGLRNLVEAQTGIRPGYVEQLYTFGDRGRMPVEGDDAPHVVSVGYLALSRLLPEAIPSPGEWASWYDFFPWEDWRDGKPDLIDNVIVPALLEWTHQPTSTNHQVRGLEPLSRVKLAFGIGETDWVEEQILERYELIYSAGLVNEAVADGRIAKTTIDQTLGSSMAHDHRRILATAIARLRGKLKYRPVIFELMQDNFTLTDLQSTVEAIFGRGVHKQNFRRLVEHAKLVEPTGASQHSTGGRPAALYRFRREILQERPAPGLKVGG